MLNGQREDKELHQPTRAGNLTAIDSNAVSAVKLSAQQVKQVMADGNRYNGLLKCTKHIC